MAHTDIMLPMVIKPEAWPATDRALWQEGLVEEDDLVAPRYAATLSATTIRNAARGYGRFLAVLAGAGALDPMLPPAQRTTPAAVQTFLNAMKTAGNSNNTICQRMWELRTALQIMVPKIDWSWITAPDGNDIRALLPRRRNVKHAIHGTEMVRWAFDLVDSAARLNNPVRRAVRHRNGLLIGILATSAPRLRSVAALRLGLQVVRDGASWRIILREEDIKTHRHHEYGLAPELVPVVDAWLDVHRPVLLRGGSHDWFWVGEKGHRLRERGIERIIRRSSQARFGRTFGPHDFRHSVATTSALCARKRPGLGAAVIGITPAVERDSYDRSRAIDIADGYHAALRAEREAARRRGGKTGSKPE